MRKIFGNGLLMAMVIMFTVALTAGEALGADYWKAKWSRFSAVAGETLAEGDVVYVDDTEGEAYLADADDSGKRPPVGVIGKGGSAEDTVEIVTNGILSGQSALSEGGYVYLSTTAGAFTQSAPGSAYNYKIGVAVSAADILIDVDMVQSASATFSNPVAGATPIEFEGASADDHETALAVADPTGDNTITFPDASGTVKLEREYVVAATAALTATYLTGGAVINNYGQATESTLTLPAAAAGYHFKYILGTAAQTSHIDPDSSDKIVLDGTALDDGDKVSNNGTSSVLGESLECRTFKTGASSYDWHCDSVGTWSDGG